MGKYIEWSDVADVYPVLNKGPTPAIVNSAFILRCEAYIEGVLSNNFTAPFSTNNATVRHLCIDYVYINLAVNKDKAIDRAEKRFNTYIDALNGGSMNMVSDSGDIIERSGGQKAWSNTMSYHTAFGVDSYTNWSPDNDQILDDHEARDL